MNNLEKAWDNATPMERAAAVCILLRKDCAKCPLHKKSCIFDDVKVALATWAKEPAKC